MNIHNAVAMANPNDKWFSMDVISCIHFRTIRPNTPFEISDPQQSWILLNDSILVTPHQFSEWFSVPTWISDIRWSTTFTENNCQMFELIFTFQNAQENDIERDLRINSAINKILDENVKSVFLFVYLSTW